MRFFLGCFLSFFLMSSIACQASNQNQPFDAFWKEFRNAVLTEDYPSLNKLVKFPLEVKGVDDETPANFYVQGELAEIFPKLLDQVVYNYEKEDLEENSLRELIRKKEVITIATNKTHHRLDQFEFQNINGQWMLTKAYLE